MKTKRIIEALMWLPGFAPEENPLEILGSASDAPTVLSIPKLTPEIWSRFDGSPLLNLKNDDQKFAANIAAIELSQQLLASERTPTEAERNTLQCFTGWGGLPKAFMLDHPEWGDKAQQLKSLLDEKEYVAASSSTVNAHFTPITVIDAVWSMVKKLGFNGGKVLEPSAGVGYFIGAMPKEVAEKSQCTAIELDQVSASLLSSLYAQYGVTVMNEGFETAPIAEGFYDLVISNVPFGNYQVCETRNVPFADFLIHDYFFARAFEVVRPGGLVAFVTSSGTLDKSNSTVREYLAQQGELVAAFRLPNSTFKQIANTSVTSDILIFKKRETPIGDVSAQGWIETERLPYGSALLDASIPAWQVVNTPLYVNQYFQHHQSNVIGKIGTSHNGYTRTASCIFDGDLVEALAERVATLQEGVYVERKAVKHAKRKEQAVELSTAHSGFVVINGLVHVADGFTATLHAAPAKTLARIIGLCQIRDAARTLIEAQPATEDDSLLSVYRVALNVAYDGFVKQHGFIHADANRRAFRNDPDLPLALSLEIWDEKAQIARKADLFDRRTVGVFQRVEHCESVQDALMVCLIELGMVDEQRISSLTGKSVKEVSATLEDEALAFLDPETGEWETIDAYLSGNVRQKLIAARLSGRRFERNVQALEAIQPKALAPHEITARIGASWIPAKVFAEFMKEVLEAKDADVYFSHMVGAWSVSTDYSTTYSVKCTQQYGTNRSNAVSLMEMALNQQVPTLTDADPRSTKRVVNQSATIAAREKQQALKDAFSDWVWSDDQRAAWLADIYNTRLNCTVPQKFDGAHLALPGFSNTYTLYPHQRNAIWRAVSGKQNTLLAHVVGAGKTLTMICSGMELRRLGKASKPLYVVPNHMLEQFAAEFLRAYPGAKVLMASKDDLGGDRRREFLSRIATGDWDAVLMTHSSFERIKVSNEFLTGKIGEEIAQIEAAMRQQKGNGNTKIIKELARAKKQWEAKLVKLSSQHKKDETLSFEELGIDWLFIDEAHLFKNLYRFTKLTNVAGLPNSNSERAFDMLIKTQLVVERRKEQGLDAGIVFATGTPVSNSMAELWVMQRYLQQGALDDQHIGQFDSWAGTFGESVTALELSPDGATYRMQTRFAKFVNLPELMTTFREVADIQTADMLSLPVPEARRSTIVAKPSEAVKEYVQTLVARAERIRNGNVSPCEDNMLAVTGDGRKAALDLRLVDPSADEAAGCKIALCADKVFGIWQATEAARSAQLVFCDMSTPKKDGSFSAYDTLREKLVEMGVPADEIAFIHDANSDAAKASLFSDVRTGRVRVLMGSTSKMGVGTNVQDRLVALHHLDPTWKPSDIEQREGRIIRQGCLNALVEIYRYVTEATFDAYSWQTLETKSRFIAQIMSGDTAIRSVEDVELAALTYAEVKALASGNPLVLEKAGVDAELVKLSLLKTQWQQQNWCNRKELSQLPQMISSAKQYIARTRNDIAKRVEVPADGFKIQIGGNTYTDKKKSRDAIKVAANSIGLGGSKKIGRFAGFDVVLERGYHPSSPVDLSLHGENHYKACDISSTHIISHLENLVLQLEERLAGAEQALQRSEARLIGIQIEVVKTFDKEDRLIWLRQRQAEIESMFDLNVGVTMDVDGEQIAA